MKLVREHINEKFVEDSDPISDMGIGLKEEIKRAIFLIFEEDEKNNFILRAPSKGNIFYIKVTRYMKVSARTGNLYQPSKIKPGSSFQIHFYSDNFYHPTQTYKNGEPKKISKRKYAIELVEKVGLSEYFNDVYLQYKVPWNIIFTIKPQFREYFIPGDYEKNS